MGVPGYLISAIIPILSLAGAVWYNRISIRLAKERWRHELSQSQSAEAEKAQAAQLGAQAAIAAASEQLAKSSFAMVDRLQADLNNLRAQHATEISEANFKIAGLKTRVVDLELELETIKRKDSHDNFGKS